MKLFVAAIIGGAALGAFRHWPKDGPTTATGAFVMLLAGVALAFYAGWTMGRGGGRATATATATATASADAEATASSTSAAHQAVNVLVVNREAGAGAGIQRVESAPWWTGEPSSLAGAEAMLEGATLDELGESVREGEGETA